MPAADLPALDALDQAVAGHESRLITSSVLRFAPALGVGAEEVYSVHVQTDDGRFSAELGGGDMYESLGYMGCLRAVLDLASGAEPAVAWEVSRRVIRTTVDHRSGRSTGSPQRYDRCPPHRPAQHRPTALR